MHCSKTGVNISNSSLRRLVLRTHKPCASSLGLYSKFPSTSLTDKLFTNSPAQAPVIRKFHTSIVQRYQSNSSQETLNTDINNSSELYSEATGINFSASPFNYDTLCHRINTYVTTESEEYGPLTDRETISLLNAITVDYGAYASRVLGYSDSEILRTQMELLNKIYNSEQGSNRLILTPGTIRPIFLSLVNNEWRTEEFVKPGVKMGPWELKEREKQKLDASSESKSNASEQDTQATDSLKLKDTLSTTNIVVLLLKAYNRKYSNAVIAKRAKTLAAQQSSPATLPSGTSIPTYVPIDIVSIPFRRAVYSGELDKSFEIIDQSAASPNYMRSVKDTWRKWATRWGVGTGSLILGVHGLLASGAVGTWESTSGVLAMVFAYVCNMTILGGLAFAGRISGVGEYIRWIPGTPTTYWYSHALEMKMASSIAAIDQALPENQNEQSFRVKKLLQNRKMMAVEVEQEKLMKEYWARGGEGFQWIEPDQDPADILWRQKVELTKAKRLEGQKQYGNKYDTADQIINKMSLPHASTTDIPKAPEPPVSKGLPEF